MASYDTRADIFQLIHFKEGVSHKFIELVLNAKELILKYKKPLCIRADFNVVPPQSYLYL